ncbi:MAG: hypothetical protein LKE75_11595 [Lachnospiraceae bacterium]|jgi:hypothetical protein|nr:hypothetical protein [Lachnospiraceae bacterium]MCH4032031.1 hypothetical protein [Lachnospiraceae bacterium]MCH4070648.1 hypothetical protein [Lachnospiraceae bacterium]MCH4109322.1 hypothetical protein [Lachnospiraceae bacterium]MCI1303212.1 hypothetical protein [Lachnospiraceae bacterium]
MENSTVNAHVETKIKTEAEERLNAKLSHSYTQAAAGEGRPMNEVFDDLERGLK